MNKANTSTILASSANPSKFGQSVTLTATVVRIPAGSGTATGTVTFKDGATTLGTGTLNGSGVATFTTSNCQWAVTVSQPSTVAMETSTRVRPAH